jgi:hypothetical protein
MILVCWIPHVGIVDTFEVPECGVVTMLFIASYALFGISLLFTYFFRIDYVIYLVSSSFVLVERSKFVHATDVIDLVLYVYVYVYVCMYVYICMYMYMYVRIHHITSQSRPISAPSHPPSPLIITTPTPSICMHSDMSLRPKSILAWRLRHVGTGGRFVVPEGIVVTLLFITSYLLIGVSLSSTYFSRLPFSNYIQPRHHI